MLAEAKKRLAADQALVKNLPGYHKALARQLRQRDDSGMNARLAPATTTAAGLEATLTRAATDAALIVVSLKVEAAGEPTPVPGEHHGKGAYAYVPAQLFGELRVVARFGAADKTRVGEWLRVLEAAHQPLPFVDKVASDGGDLVVSARCLVELPVTPPRHVIAPLTIESLAADAGVEAPPLDAFGAERATLDELMAMHTKLLPEIDKALAVLGRSHLEAERFRIYTHLADGVDDALRSDHGHP